MSTLADQGRITASLASLEHTRNALPSIIPWVTGPVLGQLAEFGDGLALDSGDVGDAGDAGEKERSGRGFLRRLVDTLRDTFIGLAGGAIGNSIVSGAEEQEAHEDADDRAENAMTTCERVLGDIQAACADAVDGCVDRIVVLVQSMEAQARALDVSDPAGAAAVRQAMAQAFEAACIQIKGLLEGRNSAMEDCMDLAIAECLPAAEEGNCRTPLSSGLVPVAATPDCEVAPVPEATSPPTKGAAQTVATAPAAAIPSAAGSLATAAAGAVSGPVPAPPPVDLPGAAADVGGWFAGAVDTVVDTVLDTAVEIAVQNSGLLVDVDVNLCPPADCPEEPVVETPQEECPDPEPEPEPEPTPPPPPVEKVPDKGFDKTVHAPQPVVADPPDAAPPAEPPVDTAAVEEPGPHGDTGPEETAADGPVEDGWTPDLWVTDAESAHAAPVERSGEW